MVKNKYLKPGSTDELEQGLTDINALHTECAWYA